MSPTRRATLARLNEEHAVVCADTLGIDRAHVRVRVELLDATCELAAEGGAATPESVSRALAPSPSAEPPSTEPPSTAHNSRGSGVATGDLFGTGPLLTPAAPAPAPGRTIPPCVSSLRDIGDTDEHDEQEWCLYVARKPIAVATGARERQRWGSLSDGKVQVKARWITVPVPELEHPAGTLLRCRLNVLRRTEGGRAHATTIAVRVQVKKDNEVSDGLGDNPPSADELRDTPWWEPGGVKPLVLFERDGVEEDDDGRQGWTFCDGGACSAALVRVSQQFAPGGDVEYPDAYQQDAAAAVAGAADGDDDDTDDGGSGSDSGGEKEDPFTTLSVSQCLLRSLTLPPVSAMRKVNPYSTVEVDEMPASWVRHCHYYYISTTVFGAKLRMELPSCVRATVRYLHPDREALPGPSAALEERPPSS